MTQLISGIARLGLLAVFALSLAALPAAPHDAARAADPRFRVLLFTKTAAFRHASIPAGVAAVQALAAQKQFAVDHTEDAAVFTDATLAQYQVVIFLNTTGDILNEAQQAAFERFVQGGGGFVGVHSATDTEYDWPWYGRLVGAYFAGHPPVQPATVEVIDRTHPSTAVLPSIWQRRDEWYDFQSAPAADVNVLALVDEDSYDGATMGEPHPIAWYHVYDGGRAWYTGMGHTGETYDEPLFREHLWGGIRWAADFTPTAYLPSVTAE